MEINKVGIIGVGTMGGSLTLLFAEKGLDVSIHDISDSNVEKTYKSAEAAGFASRVHIYKDYDELCKSLGTPKVFVFSLPIGRPGDVIVEKLKTYVGKGDIVIDACNENFEVTQARQEILRPFGAAYVGLGISGGSFGARHGPSLMPSGEKWAVDAILPMLIRIAARDDKGRPCVANIGPGGSGHFVKMIHNGIEQAIMVALAEAWELMDSGLGMDGNEIGAVFDSWNSKGELLNNFLVQISGPLCRTKANDGAGQYLLHQIRDAVVQDANDTEGYGVWTSVRALSLHVPAPSLSTAHYLRNASAEVDQRAKISSLIGNSAPGRIQLLEGDQAQFLEKLRRAVYIAVLVCFVQGLDVLDRQQRREGWNIDFPRILQIWRAGCIIRSDYLTDLLETSYSEDPNVHPLCQPRIAGDIKANVPSLKEVVLEGVKADVRMPCLSSTLEYLKYIGGTDLPTTFVEAQLDSFGAHGYDLKTEPVRYLEKGLHHATWSG